MGKIAKYLNQLIVGNVFDTPEILEEYSTDYSPLKIKPKFVIFPESTDDIQKLMRFFNNLAAKDIKVAVTTRGSGTSKTGADLSNGVIISTKKMNNLLEIDPRERLVRVQAGITLRELNTALSVSGLTIPIDGHAEETIGGLISTHTIDNNAEKYGGLINMVERIEVILANGECLQTERYKKYALAKKAAEKSFEGKIYQKMAKIIKENELTLNQINTKNLAGYPEVAKLQKRDTLDLMPLFFGAEGTLGIITEVILKAVPLKNQQKRVVATFKNINTAIKYASELELLKPRKIELYDLKILVEAREAGKNLDGIIRKMDDGFAVLANFDEKRNFVFKKIESLRTELSRTTKFIFETTNNQPILDEFENALAHYLNAAKDGEHVPILADFYLPKENLADFLQDLKVLEDKTKMKFELYGSLATSIYNLRPKFDLAEASFNKKAAAFLRAGNFIIERQGGNLAGGTSEGRLKAVVTNASMPEKEQKIYQEIKEIFDHNGVLNLATKLGADSKFTLTHLRTENMPKIVL